MNDGMPTSEAIEDEPPIVAKPFFEVAMVVRDLARSSHFYSQVMGMKLYSKRRVPNGTNYYFALPEDRFISAGEIKLLAPDVALPDSATSGGPTGGYGMRFVAIWVKDVAEIVAACEAHGYQVAMPVSDQWPGILAAFVVDPDGTWLEIAQPI